ncbi:MAG: glycosyltransferase family 1 protein [Candidatus Saganbacteria bacterium]|nr:glycosyltransferase family 1 protein [Candidatus Saganbacteria bacterium]
MPIKVFYDGYYFSRETYGGISRMWENILSGLLSEDSFECVILSDNPCNEAFKKISAKGKGKNNLRHIFQPVLRPRRIFDNIRLRGLILDLAALRNGIFRDYIFHSTLNTLPMFTFKNRIVTTVHDLNFQLFPELLGGSAGHKNFVLSDKLTIERSKKLIAVSQTTKSDILKLFKGVDPDKIDVIYHGLNSKYLDQEIIGNKTDIKYFLFVGGRNLYKNYPLLLRTFGKLYKKYNGIKLITVGPDTGNKDKQLEEGIIRENKLEDAVVDKGYLSDEELIRLYKGATALVFPSLYEGFGFPLLEAMSCGCPVIASDIPVFREIGKDNVEYFDPKSPDELFRKMENRLAAFAEPSRIKNAHAYANTFRWETAVKKTMEVYKKI